MNRLYYFFAVSVICYACNSQTLFHSNQLVGTKWELITEDSHTHLVEFKADTVTHVQIFPTTGRTISDDFLYSLNMQRPAGYDTTVMRNPSTGIYYTEYSEKYGEMTTYEIITLTEDSLILRFEDDQRNYIGGFEPISKYKRIE